MNGNRGPNVQELVGEEFKHVLARVLNPAQPMVEKVASVVESTQDLVVLIHAQVNRREKSSLPGASICIISLSQPFPVSFYF